MSGILSLAVEIFPGPKISSTDKQNLRATCSALNFAVAPLVLSHLTLDVGLPRLDRTVGKIELLATPSYRGSSYVKSVDIRSLVPKSEVTSIPALLKPALSSLHNLESLKWRLDSHDSWGTSTAVIAALSSLPGLANLDIVLPTSLAGPVPFECLRGLRSLSLLIPHGIECEQTLNWIVYPLAEAIAKSPALEHIKIHHANDAGAQVPCFHHLLAKVDVGRPLVLKVLTLNHEIPQLDASSRIHLKSLKALILVPPVERGMFVDGLLELPADVNPLVAGLWRNMAEGKVFPEGIRTPIAIDRTILDYLAVHPGLQRLDLTKESFHPPEPYDVFADFFYNDVLPRHTATLTHLSINPGRAGRWAFTENNAATILQCRALITLSMGLNNPAEGYEDAAVLLMEVAFELPHLRQLTMTLTQRFELAPVGQSGTNALWMSRKWLSMATAAVTEYRAPVDWDSTRRPMSVRVGRGVYHLWSGGVWVRGEA
ncbi:hypothetical protein C8R44DRAFT_870686 [Mycena epipterygia]|nr:hypothetical protein C8R44DRAFT_870686 [Mycena epipterygia]